MKNSRYESKDFLNIKIGSDSRQKVYQFNYQSHNNTKDTQSKNNKQETGPS